jgi:hypothetical protein
MNEKDPLQNNPGENLENTAPEIVTNPYDDAVVIEEKDRTVLLTENETIVIEKDPMIDSAPKNRPRKVYGGMWGPTEIGAVGAGAFALLALLLFYVFIVGPSNREVEAKKTERDALDKELTASKSRYGDISNTQEHVDKLKTSVNDFEVRFLPVASIGQTALYQRLNGLIASNNLINTTGPDYRPLEILDPSRPESDEEKGRSKFKSLFPGVYISMTVEGTYQNQRRFIRELESTEQFLVISSVELEPNDAEKKDKQNQQQTAQNGGPDAGSFPNKSMTGNPAGFAPAPVDPGQMPGDRQKGKTHGETVSLRIEMAAYFRRPNFGSETTQQ